MKQRAKIMETNNLNPSASATPQPIVFAIDFSEPETATPSAPAGNRQQAIVVRIEPQDLLFILSTPEPESARITFAEALAKRTALSAIEKDTPSGLELSLSARQIDRVPPEIEDRLPDFWMNGNKAWVLAPETGTVAPTAAESAAA
jgi:hypothetical protein